MANFITVTGKNDDWVTLINFDYVIRIDACSVKRDVVGALLTFAHGHETMIVKEDLETLAGMVEATRA